MIAKARKKGHRKPIRRLAMTSILKQNTQVFCPPVISLVSTLTTGRINANRLRIGNVANFRSRGAKF
jgi:hypothetical protein